MKKTITLLAFLMVILAGFTLSTGSSTTLQITNNTDQVIQHLYVSPANLLVYGSDRIGDELLRPGDRLEVVIRECDQALDLRAIPVSQGTAIEQKIGVSQCGGTIQVNLQTS